MDGILATTFTRKAAGEIMHRVLQRLAMGCISAEQPRYGISCPMWTVRSRLPVYPAAGHRSIHRLRISTLDSFFSTGTHLFAGDGTTRRVVHDGAQSGANVQCKPFPKCCITTIARLLELVRMLFKGESNRRVSDDIRSTVEGGLTLFRSSNESAWDRLPLRAQPEESAYQSALNALGSCRMPDKRINDSIEKLVGQVTTGDWGGLLSHGLIHSLQSETPTYYRKELPSELVGALRLLREKAAAELLPIYRSQTLATYRILQSYDHSYQELLRRYRTLAFADVSHFLASGWRTIF